MIGIFFATGFEEVEALTTVDLLRRASLEVSVISVTQSLEVTGGHGIKIIADMLLEDVDFTALDAIVLPGGNPGFKNLEKTDALMEKVVAFAGDSSKLVAAICGAPSLLGHKKLLEGKKATIYPGMDAELGNAKVTHASVARDGNIITSRGVGTAIDFALEIIKYYQGGAAASTIAKSIVF